MAVSFSQHLWLAFLFVLLNCEDVFSISEGIASSQTYWPDQWHCISNSIQFCNQYTQGEEKNTQPFVVHSFLFAPLPVLIHNFSKYFFLLLFIGFVGAYGIFTSVNDGYISDIWRVYCSKLFEKIYLWI